MFAAPMRTNHEHTPLSKLTRVICIASEFMSDGSHLRLTSGSARQSDGNSGSFAACVRKRKLRIWHWYKSHLKTLLQMIRRESCFMRSTGKPRDISFNKRAHISMYISIRRALIFYLAFVCRLPDNSRYWYLSWGHQGNIYSIMRGDRYRWSTLTQKCRAHKWWTLTYSTEISTYWLREPCENIFSRR
jgi:hypothetical protein